MIKLAVMVHGNVFFFWPTLAWVSKEVGIWSIQVSLAFFTFFVEFSPHRG